MSALRRRLAPFYPLTLELPDASGAATRLDLRLAFDFNALAALEEQTGANPLSGDMWRSPTAASLSALFWASLLAHQPEYEGAAGLKVARSYMDAGNAVAITQAVREAYVLSLPADQQRAIREGDGLNPPPPAVALGAAPAGSTSGPSPATSSALAPTSSAA